MNSFPILSPCICSMPGASGYVCFLWKKYIKSRAHASIIMHYGHVLMWDRYGIDYTVHNMPLHLVKK